MINQDTITSTQIATKAKALGFDEVAIAPARPLQSGHLYTQWLAENRHGEMHYLDRYHDLRVNPQVLEPGTQTVIVVLKNYYLPSDYTDGGLRIARYAHGDDYHNHLRDQLKTLGQWLTEQTGATINTRPAVDSAPLLERDLAQSTNLGWIGKNSMLIHPQLGSFCFIAELLLDIPLQEYLPKPTPDRCGRCTACMDACPTHCIISPRVIDARRCLAYLTIEHRGAIPRDLRPKMRDFLFGCDLCQDVCPWNSKAQVNEDERLQTRARYQHLKIEDVLQMTQEVYSTTFSKSAIKRTKRQGLLRNAAIVIGNRAQAEDLSLLIERLSCEPDAVVRLHIVWAMVQIGLRHPNSATQTLDAIHNHAHTETDDDVIEEMQWATTQLSFT